MACNCNKGGKASSYIYRAPNGTTKTYRTEIEAQAAKIRNGGGSYTTVTK
jgi:hypothetical protein